MATSSADGREVHLVSLTNKQLWSGIAAVAAIMLGTMFGGYKLYFEEVVSGLRGSVAEMRDLRAQDSNRFDGEDQSLREAIEQQGRNLTADLRQMTNEIVETNREISRQVGQLRQEVRQISIDSENRMMSRFDRLETRLDRFSPMGFEPIPVEPGMYEVREDGSVYGSEGERIGRVPAYLDLLPKLDR